VKVCPRHSVDSLRFIVTMVTMNRHVWKGFSTWELAYLFFATVGMFVFSSLVIEEAVHNDQNPDVRLEVRESFSQFPTIELIAGVYHDAGDKVEHTCGFIKVS